jgi:cell division protein FtsB
MDRLKQLITPLARRIILAIVLVIAIILFMDFNARISELFRKNIIRNEVHQEVYQLELTKQALVTQIAYATSDVAVEEWAREQGHLVRPGDIPIVPLMEPDLTPTPPINPTPIRPSIANWEVWQALFFGE